MRRAPFLLAVTLTILAVTVSASKGEDSRGLPQFHLQPESLRPKLSLRPDPVRLEAGSRLILAAVGGPERAQVTTIDATGVLRVWNLARAESVVAFTFDEELSCAAISPNARCVAAVSIDGNLKLLQMMPTPACRDLQKPSRAVALKFSNSGEVFAAVASDGSVESWNAKTGEQQPTSNNVHGAAQTRPASGSADQQRATALSSPTESVVYSMAFSPDDGQLVIAAANGAAELIDLAGDRPRRNLLAFGSRITSLAFAPHGMQLAAGNADGTVRYGNISAADSIRVLTGHTFGVWSTQYDASGEVLASASWDGAIRLWEVSTAKLLGTFKAHDESVPVLAFSKEEGGLFSASLNGVLNYWPADVPAFAPWASITGHPGPVWVSAFSPDGKTLATGGDQGFLGLWDLEHRKLARKLAGHAVTRCAEFSPDGRLLATGGSDKAVCLWDVQSGDRVVSWKAHPGLISAVTFSPDGKLLASCCDGRAVKLWDVVNRKEKEALLGHREQVYCASFSPDGRWLATGGGNWTANVPGELKIWDVETGKEHASLAGHRLSIWTVSFSPDGKKLATSSSDSTVRIWDLTSFSVERVLELGVWLRAMAFAPDGKTLAVGRGDGIVRLWDVATWQERASLTGHSSFAFSMQYSARAHLLATAGNDRTVHLWKVPPH